jgi:hypothetical protein
MSYHSIEDASRNSIIEDAKYVGLINESGKAIGEIKDNYLIENLRRFAYLQAARQSSQSEPVAWGFPNTAITGSKNALMMVRIDVPSDDQYGGALWIPLYAAPQQAIPSGWIPKLGDLVHPSKAVCDKYPEWKPDELLKIVGINYKRSSIAFGKFTDVIDITIVEMANEHGATDGWKLEDIVPASPTAPTESDK